MEEELCRHDLDRRCCAVCKELHPLDALLLEMVENPPRNQPPVLTEVS